MSEVITPLNWTRSTNQMVYRKYSSSFPLTKLEVDSGENLQQVWKRLCSPSLTSLIRQSLFLPIHNKLPLKERLFRIGLENDPYCVYCIEKVGSFICDREHTFCTCSSVLSLWRSIRDVVDTLVGNASCLDLLTLNFNGGDYDDEVTWLIGLYVHEIWKVATSGGGTISHDELFGFLKFKFKQEQHGAQKKMKSLPNFS